MSSPEVREVARESADRIVEAIRLDERERVHRQVGALVHDLWTWVSWMEEQGMSGRDIAMILRRHVFPTSPVDSNEERSFIAAAVPTPEPDPSTAAEQVVLSRHAVADQINDAVSSLLATAARLARLAEEQGQ